MGQKPDRTWKFVRDYCPNRDCRNPHHYRLQKVRKYDGSPIVEPPPTYFSPALRKGTVLPDPGAPDGGLVGDPPCLDTTVEHPDDFRDACDFIEDDDSRARRGMSPQQLHEVFSGYPVGLYERALAHVNRPRFWSEAATNLVPASLIPSTGGRGFDG